MDFTPMNLSKINSQVQRRTTASFELATSILFLSGIQHYAESPEGMKAVPEVVKNLLRNLPDQWEDSRFISGYPGKDVVIARNAKDTWYVAGINGENAAKNIQLDLTPFSGKKILKIADGKEQNSFLIEDNLSNKKLTIPLQPNGGFVLMIQ